MESSHTLSTIFYRSSCIYNGKRATKNWRNSCFKKKMGKVGKIGKYDRQTNIFD